MNLEIESLIIKETKRLIFYSPYRFIKDINPETITNETVINPLLNDILSGEVEVMPIKVNNWECFFLIKKLNWDSDFFGFDNYKIINVFYQDFNFELLVKAIKLFKKTFSNRPKAYFFADIPNEDIQLIQAFNQCGYRSVETRLNYYYEGVEKFQYIDRYAVRLAKAGDAESLKEVAIRMRNKFDRLHADAQIDDELADNYIGKFAYNSVMGFADYVVVPDVVGVNPFGFLASNKPVDVMGKKISKLVLAAIDNSIQKGWLIKLLSETLYLLKEQETDYLTTITQTSNIAAFRTWEKFGFKLGYVTSILAHKND